MARTTFASRLRKHRLAFPKTGLSQGELAKRVGLSRQAIQKFEAGERAPTLETAKKLARALGVTVDELGGEYDT